MAGNTFGNIFKITTWGESHGRAIGCVVDGCPAGILVEEEFIQEEMKRRSPGQSKFTTSRTEMDHVQFLSGIFEGKTTGAPISMVIENNNRRSEDYDSICDLYRPGHADYTYHDKYGIRDYRGGGRSSARTTAALVAGGAIAKLVLNRIEGFEIFAYTKAIYTIEAETDSSLVNRKEIEKNPVRCPDEKAAQKMMKLIENIKESGDSVGGVIECVVRGVPSGLGEPVFDKLDAELAKAMLSINAVKGFEIGSGFNASRLKGSENNDGFISNKGKTSSNHAGGVLGGISSSMPIVFRAAFKPTPSISLEQNTVDIHGEAVSFFTKGRHDPCVVPRAVPVVEAMAALVLCDFFLLHQKDRMFL